jgi:hypothetical protein
VKGQRLSCPACGSTEISREELVERIAKWRVSPCELMRVEDGYRQKCDERKITYEYHGLSEESPDFERLEEFICLSCHESYESLDELVPITDEPAAEGQQEDTSAA